jgi:hypothetical protein
METNPTQLKDPKWRSNLQLGLRIYPERPVFHEAVLKSLHRVIEQHLPVWSSELKAARHEDVKSMTSVASAGSLAEAIDRASPVRQHIGVRSAVLKGAYKGISFFLVSCEETLPPEINRISIEVRRLMTIEGRAPAEWAWTFFEQAVTSLPVRYANAQLDDEWDAKNVINNAEGVRAVGVKLDVSLPGLYWLNYFGSSYLKLIGENRLLSSPAYAARKLSNGVLVALDTSPLNWQTPDYNVREQKTITHIGPEYFFLKGEPDRRLKAPDFRAG